VLFDRAFRLAFRNYSTLFFVVAVVTVTLHLVFSFFFRDVIAVSELHLEISNLSPNVKIQGVGPPDLSASETFFWVLTAVEIATVPVFAGAAARVIEVDREGGVATVPDAYAHARSGLRSLTLKLSGRGWGIVLVGAATALVAGYLFERAGLLLTEVISDDWLFLGAGLVRGLSRAVGAPFFLAAVVTAAESARREPVPA
jgi:hypothetical protein